jgi:integrase
VSVPSPGHAASVSGSLRLRRGRRRSSWYAVWRDGAGQHQRKLGAVWEGRGAPPAGALREREARQALEAILVDARRGAAAQARTGVTFADVAVEWWELGQVHRDWKPSTVVDYRSVLNRHLLPRFGELRVEAVSPAAIERWRDGLVRTGGSRRNANKLLATLHSIFEHARERHGLRVNPAAAVRPLRDRYDQARFDFYSPEEVMALVRSAASEQDAAIYLTAAFSGLRMGECLGLRWRDVDFENRALRAVQQYTRGQLVTPKSGHGRSMPLVDPAAQALARLSQRDRHTGREHFVLCSPQGEPLDDSALRRRYKSARDAAGLRPLRFHDLRHTFGSLAINHASIVQVQAWMGHADIKTTMRYLHHKSRAGEAELLSVAFAVDAASAAAPSAAGT